MQYTDEERQANAAKAVANGSLLLDRLLGTGWPLLVDLDTFNISEGSHCVLGQVFRPQFIEDGGREYSPISGADEVVIEGRTTVNGFDYGLAAINLAAGLDVDADDEADVADEFLSTFLNGYVQDLAFEGGWDAKCGFMSDVGLTFADLQVEWEKVIGSRQMVLLNATTEEERRELRLKVIESYFTKEDA